MGKSKDAMKLQWDLPKINPEAATRYIVEFRKAGKNAWEKSTETPEQWHIVRKLKSNTRYEFRVSSWNEEAERVKRNIEEMLRKAREEGLKGGTRLGKFERTILSAIGFLGGTAVAPLLATVGVPALMLDSKKAAVSRSLPRWGLRLWVGRWPITSSRPREMSGIWRNAMSLEVRMLKVSTAQAPPSVDKPTTLFCILCVIIDD